MTIRWSRVAGLSSFTGPTLRRQQCFTVIDQGDGGNSADSYDRGRSFPLVVNRLLSMLRPCPHRSH